MTDNRPYLEIPVPSEEDHRLFEEWLRRHGEEKDNEKSDEDREVVVINI
tara:strand:- start:309 stop:455 length:147 start_codon:yes stop_codon:yes gene_type:complete